MANPVTHTKISPSPFPVLSQDKPLLGRCNEAIAQALKVYNYAEHEPKLEGWRKEAQTWQAWSETIKYNRVDAKTISQPYERIIGIYIEIEEACAQVKKVSELFQKTFDLCYPKGTPPKLDPETLKWFNLLECDLAPFQTKYHDVLVMNFHSMEEKNGKMKSLNSDISKILSNLKDYCESAADLCRKDKDTFRIPFSKTWFERDVEAHKIELKQGKSAAAASKLPA